MVSDLLKKRYHNIKMIMIKSAANIILAMAKTRHKQRVHLKNQHLFIKLEIFSNFIAKRFGDIEKIHTFAPETI